jgi:hypothetical protein
MWGTECPNCERPIWVNLADLSRSFHCSQCGTWLRAKVQPNGTRKHIEFGYAATEGSTAKPSSSDVRPEFLTDRMAAPQETQPPRKPPIREAVNWEAAAAGYAPHSSPTMPAAGPPPGGRQTHDPRLAASPFVGYEPEPSDESSEQPFEMPESNIDRAATVRTGSRLSPRLVRMAILYSLWWGPIVFVFSVLLLEGSPPIAYILCGIFMALPWFWWSPWFIIPVMRGVLVAMFPTFACPGCHEPHSAVDVWRCSCGYQDHREKNVFLFKCPNCRGRIGRVDCPKCDSTILL